jgi:hypothetical protein
VTARPGLRVGLHSDLREHGPQAAVYREMLDLFPCRGTRLRPWPASSAATGHPQRLDAIETVARKIAPRLGWTPGQQAA